MTRTILEQANPQVGDIYVDAWRKPWVIVFVDFKKQQVGISHWNEPEDILLDSLDFLGQYRFYKKGDKV